MNPDSGFTDPIESSSNVNPDQKLCMKDLNQSVSPVYSRYRVPAGTVCIRVLMTVKSGLQFFGPSSLRPILISSKIIPLVFSLCQQDFFEFFISYYLIF
jgi:hypothetical protein